MQPRRSHRGRERTTRKPRRIILEVPAPVPFQEHAIFGPHRYAVIEASTKTGKTVNAFWWLFDKMASGPDHGIYWWVAPSHKTARMAFERAKVWLAPLLKSGRLKKNEQGPRRITDTVTGAYIDFFSTDDTDSIYGDEPHAVVCDEASRHRSESIDAIETTLLVHSAPIRYIGNVKNRHCWFWKQCRAIEADAHEHETNGTPLTFDDWVWARWTIWDAVDAGIHRREDVEKLRDRYFRTGRRAIWYRDYEAKLDGIGVAFSEEHYAAMRVAPKVDYGTVIMGIDPGGKRHPAGIVVIRARLSEDGGPEAEVLHSEAWRGSGRMLRTRVVELADEYDPVQIVSDRAMALLTEDLEGKYGSDAITVATWRDPVRWQHFETLRSLAADERLRVPEEFEGLYEDFQNAALDDDGADVLLYPETTEEEIRDGEIVTVKRHCDELEALLRALSVMGRYVDTRQVEPIVAGDAGVGGMDDELDNWLAPISVDVDRNSEGLEGVAIPVARHRNKVALDGGAVRARRRRCGGE